MDKKKSSPLKLTVDNDVLGTLDQIAVKIRQEIREGKLPKRGPGRSVGAATIAADIVERIVRDHPELLKEFFEDETSLTPADTATRIEELASKKSARKR